MAKSRRDPDSDDDILIEARKAYDRCVEAWNENQNEAKEDLRFGRLGLQWPEAIRKARETDPAGPRPCLTFNKMPAFIRQVVNDARQNKPAIKVHPQDSGADKRTAEILDGLIRNIETTSDADVAYDTAIEHAVGQGFGFWQINVKYACDDTFDMDIVVERVMNPFTVYGDPDSQTADSSDWNVAFVASPMPQAQFKREYPNAEKVDWTSDFRDAPGWLDGDNVIVAAYWTREKVKTEIVALSDGSTRRVDELEEAAEELQALGVMVVGEPREVETYKVTQRIMSGAEVLKTVDWVGKYIPIVPVYGDEVVDDHGKRHFRSLIRDAKSAQQMLNYWRTTSTEVVALAPRAPFIGEEGAFDADPNWNTANSQAHSKLEYSKGAQPPQRQPFAGIPAGALQEALNANDDMKSIIGIYDASLGARSNETSGVAIRARKMEGDVSTFHFIDNLSRAIRHGGRILLDLIPKVYTTDRMIRVLGEDLTAETVQIAKTGQAVTEQKDEMGKVIGAVYDITAGKYDITVSAGPSFTTRREEAAQSMREMMQAVPDTARVIGDIWADMQDWPQSDKIKERLQALLPPELKGEQGIPPQVQQQVQQMGQMIQQGAQELQRLTQENQQLKIDQQNKSRELDIREQEVGVKAFDAETQRIQAQQPSFVKMPPTGMPGTA